MEAQQRNEQRKVEIEARRAAAAEEKRKLEESKKKPAGKSNK